MWQFQKHEKEDSFLMFAAPAKQSANMPRSLTKHIFKLLLKRDLQLILSIFFA